MQTERGSTHIGKFPLQNFIIKQSKKLQDSQHRAVLYSANSAKTVQIVFGFSFNFDALITHFQLESHKFQLFNSCFQIIEAQADVMGSRGQFSQMLNFNINLMNNNSNINNQSKNPELQNKMIIDSIGYTNSVRFRLILKNDAVNYHMEQLGLKKQRNKNIQEQNIRKMIYASISSIDIWGFVPNVSPLAHHLTRLLNISQAFKKFGRLQEAAQSDILVSLSLINARRFIQAAELLKKVSKYYVQKYISNKSGMEYSRMQKSWIRDIQSKDDQDGTSLGRSFGTGRVLQGGKFLIKAAKVQLILAQTITHPSLIMDKLQAYSCANYYFNGNPNPISLPPNSDLLQVTQSIGPQIINFLIKILYDKSQPLRIAALKSIEFIFQTLGCTMANFIVPLVKSMISTYPNKQSNNVNMMHSPIGINLSSSEVNAMISTRNKLLTDHYHHLMETLLTLFQQIAKKYLKLFFSQIILPNISNNQFSPQLKLYLLRFCQKIISICTADLQYHAQFFVTILNLCQSKHNSQTTKSIQNKHTNYNLTYFAQKNLDIIKSKILPKIHSNYLIPICQWINQTLSYLCENQTASLTANASSFYLNQALDFIIIIYSRKNLFLFSSKVNYPVEPILYFMNMSISQDALPFDKILHALVQIINCLTKQNPQAQIVNQIVERIMGKSKLNNLNIKELKILYKVLQISADPQIQWLQMFLSCIPHSTFDEIYMILDILLIKCQKNLDKPILIKIVTTLLDQYTVKGKAYQQSKQNLIEILLQDSNKEILISFIQLCLLQNIQPNVQKYHARRRKNLKQHTFDSKLFKIDYQMFLDKLGLVQFLLSKIETVNCQHISRQLQNQQLVCDIYQSLYKLLTSINGKLKNKGLSILKYFIYAFETKNQSKINSIQLFFSKAALSLAKAFMQNSRDSKLQFNAINIIQQLFQRILKIDLLSPIKDEQSIDQAKLSFMDGNIQCWNKENLDIQYSISDSLYINLRLRQIIKLWPMLTNLYGSPWECVRQMVSIFLIKFLMLDLTNYRISLQNKFLQLAKPMLKNLFNTNDHIQRQRAIKIFACLLGITRKYKNKSQVPSIIRENIRSLKQFIPKIFELQEDWDENIAEISQCIISLCVTPQNMQTLRKKILYQKRNQNNYPQNSFCTFNLGEQFLFEKKPSSFFANNMQDMQYFLKESSHFDTQQEVYFKLQQIKNDQEVPNQISNTLWQKLLSFGHYIESSISKKPDTQKDSFAQQQQQFFQANEQRAQSIDAKQSKSQQQHLQFQDLGIIQLDDQQWGQQQNEVKITQKLPLKKIYKLSPSVGGSSKPQRIRSKRYNNTDMDHPQNIIVDQLQGRIQSKARNQKSIQRNNYFMMDIPQQNAQINNIQKSFGTNKQLMSIKPPKMEQNFDDVFPQYNNNEEYQQLPLKSKGNLKQQFSQQILNKQTIQSPLLKQQQLYHTGNINSNKQKIIQRQFQKLKQRPKQKFKNERQAIKKQRQVIKEDLVSSLTLNPAKKKKTSRKRKPSMNKQRQKYKQI